MVSTTILTEVIIQGVFIGGLFATAALGMTLIFGVVDVLNVAHGAVIMIGLYVSYFLSIYSGLNPWILTPITVGIVFLLGVLIERSTVSKVVDEAHHVHLVLTMGWWILLENLVLVTVGPDFYSLDVNLPFLKIGGISLDGRYMLAFCVCIGTVIMFNYFLKNTKLGRAIRATARNLNAAHYVGIDVDRVYYLTFGLGCALAGLAATAIVTLQPIYPGLGDLYLTYVFIIIVLGGLGSFTGALAGGFIVGGVIELGSFFFPGTWNKVLLFIVFITILALKPEGLFGGSEGEE